MKNEIHQLEFKNKQNVTKSKDNQTKISKLMETLEDLKKDKEVRKSNLKTGRQEIKEMSPLKLNLDTNETISQFNIEDPIMTKRSSAITDRMFFRVPDQVLQTPINYRYDQ